MRKHLTPELRKTIADAFLAQTAGRKRAPHGYARHIAADHGVSPHDVKIVVNALQSRGARAEARRARRQVTAKQAIAEAKAQLQQELGAHTEPPKAAGWAWLLVMLGVIIAAAWSVWRLR